MGLNVRIYNIVSDGNYILRYKSGDNPYPVETDSSFTTVGTYTTSTTTVEIEDLEFDTQYWIKMTDVTTGRYIVKNIYVHDSKAYPCYDTMCFNVEVICDTAQPTATPSPTSTPNPTPTQTTESTLYYQVRLVTDPNTCALDGSIINVTFDNTDPAFLGYTPIINDYVTLLGGGYTGCWKVLSSSGVVTTSTAITAINFGNCQCLN